MSSTRRRTDVLSPKITRSMTMGKENIASTRSKNKVTTYSTMDKENIVSTGSKNKITTYSTRNVNIKTTRKALGDIQNDVKDTVTKGKSNITSKRTDSLPKTSKLKKVSEDLSKTNEFSVKNTNKSCTAVTKKSTNKRSVSKENENKTGTKAKSWSTVRSRSDAGKSTSTKNNQSQNTNKIATLKTSKSLVLPEQPKTSSRQKSLSTIADLKIRRSTRTKLSLLTDPQILSPMKTPLVEVSPRKSEILASIPTVYNTTMNKKKKPFLIKLGTICEDDNLIIPNEKDIRKTVQFKRGCDNTNDTSLTFLDDSLDNLKQITNINFIRGEYSNFNDDDDDTSNIIIDG